MPEEPENLDWIRDEILSSSSEVQALWYKTEEKRRFSLMFARMREWKGLSQKDVAERAKWDKAFVSRLEAAQGSLPDLQTLARFADACGLLIGLVVCDRDSEGKDYFHVVDAVTLPPRMEEGSSFSKDALKFERLHGRNLYL